MNSLNQQRCTPSRKDTPALDRANVDRLLAQLDEWSLDAQAGWIEKRFRFQNFCQTMAFVNAIAFIAQREDHHPEMHVSYNACQVRYTTHVINGLSANDFICAAHIDALL